MNRFLKYAGKMAEMSNFNGQKVGCVITYKNKIISTGFNSEKTHTIQEKYNKYRNFDKPDNVQAKLHAEIHALSHIQYADIDWKKVAVYVSRIRNDMSYGLARPCAACMEFIKYLGINKIVYTTNDGWAVENILKEERVA